MDLVRKIAQKRLKIKNWRLRRAEGRGGREGEGKGKRRREKGKRAPCAAEQHFAVFKPAKLAPKTTNLSCHHLCNLCPETPIKTEEIEAK